MDIQGIYLLFKDNPRDIFTHISSLLIHLCDDLLTNQKTSQYCTIKVNSLLFQEKFLPISGAVECLFYLGYEEQEDSFVLHSSASLDKIRNFREKLTELRSKCVPIDGMPRTQRSSRVKQIPTTSKNPNQQTGLSGIGNTESLMETEKKFYKELEAKANHVLMYEDPDLQNLALEHIPVEELSQKASKRHASLGGKQKIGVGEEDFLILEFLHWFKFVFFTWVDIPKCENCGQIPEKKGATHPTSTELKWGANRVESYFCIYCQKNVRFPRYNHPKKLLETRRGRCGEWANCFTLLCRALGYEARLVVEWSDHVWTEIYSVSQKRWLHCDPCENLCDAPLVYESGWKKEIAYVIAFSKDEIQDVTWRYSSNHNEVIKRRTLCRETWLLQRIMAFTASLQTTLTVERKNELVHRKLSELVEFLTPRNAKGNETSGRISGSLAWRVARGEYDDEIAVSPYIFHLNADEIKNKHFHVKYSCAADKYVRVSDNFSEVDKWENFIFEKKNVFRKIEHDWNMVYLARKEGSSEGYITWKFDFQDCDLVIDVLNFHLNSKQFENGEVSWILISGKTVIPLKESSSVIVKDLQGSREFALTAQLSGGRGTVAWQHAQLFRQLLTSMDFPFEIVIKFM